MTRLPVSLDSEPLVDAIFEFRMGGNPHVADILPGILFSQNGPKPSLVRLPTAEIPQPIRDQDPNLVFAPILRLEYQQYTVSFGDRSLSIACKLPYPKWAKFKEIILKVVNVVSGAGMTGAVERYSMKYVNLIQAPTIAEQLSKIDITIRVGDVNASREHVNVQVHKNEDDIIHIISVLTGAQVTFAGGGQAEGVIVDIDSIRACAFASIQDFSSALVSSIETLRLANKTKFFSCLTPDTISQMGPHYE